MSTSSVSSPKKRSTGRNPAKWDDEKTRILLEVIVNEIDSGNRPSGVFSRQGWTNIVNNFNEKTGRNWSKDQLKNRQDNLRKEFSKWEKLIGKETGLEWDFEKQTLSAPDAWWEERAKSDPMIMKYRDGGPVHLELLQQVFSGITATGFYSYIPEDTIDPLLNEGDVLENMTHDGVNCHNVTQDDPTLDTCQDGEPVCSQITSRSNLRGPKRKRLSSGSRLSTSDKLLSSMDSMTSAMNRSIDRFNPEQACKDEAEAYKECLTVLKAIPGMNNTNGSYFKAVRLLKDKLNRIAFYHLLEEGHHAVLAWIQCND